MEFKELFEKLHSGVEQLIIGLDRPITELLISFLCNGHILLEGAPGVGKTLLTRTLAALVSAEFNRVQGTPDLMPADLTGINIYNQQQQAFNLVKGPIFTDILLFDEINRTTPKTQSALLQAMEEKFINLDRFSHKLSDHFTVMATQNPLEFEGTYPLPESQSDRFFMKIFMSYPQEEEEIKILKTYADPFHRADSMLPEIKPVASLAEVHAAGRALSQVTVTEEIYNYIMQLVNRTRQTMRVILGISPRGALHLTLAAKAQALISGRDFVTPDDIKMVIRPVWRHRLVLAPEQRLEGTSADSFINEVLNQIVVPR